MRKNKDTKDTKKIQKWFIAHTYTDSIYNICHILHINSQNEFVIGIY